MIQPLIENLKTALSLSNVRCQLLNKNWDEDSQSEFSSCDTFGKAIAYLGANKVGISFKRELKESIAVAKVQDEEIKAKKGGAKADAKSKKKAGKNAAPPAPPGIQLGRGSRTLFEFVSSGSLLQNEQPNNFNVALNKELQGELSEILQVRN